MDPSMVNLLSLTTTIPPSFGEMIRPHMTTILWIAGAAGLIVLCAVTFCVAKTHYNKVSTTVLGVPRIMQIYRSDPVNVFPARGVHKKPKVRDIPDDSGPRERERVRRQHEKSLNEALELAVQSAYNKGANHIISCSTAPEPVQRQAIEEAIQNIEREHLDRCGDHVEKNCELIKKGRAWCRMIDAERALAVVVEKARPNMETAGLVRHTKKPEIGGISAKGPWHTTLKGQESEGAVKTAIWANVENLTAAIKESEAQGASPHLIKDAGDLLSGIIARTRELPADRCVLDPTGQGLRLLPPGRHRAIQPSTGDAYVYQRGSLQGDDALKPWEQPIYELGNISVDDCRPVCSIFVDKGYCQLDRRCPWRHCQPRKGDTIREPVQLDDDD